MLRWDRNTQAFQQASSRYFQGTPGGPNQGVPGANGQAAWPLNRNDEFLVVDLHPTSLSHQQVVLVRSSSRKALAVLRYTGSGGLEVAWQAANRIGGAGSTGLDWELQPGNRVITTDVDGNRMQELVMARRRGGSQISVVTAREDDSLVVSWIAQQRVFSPDPWGGTQGWQLTQAARTHYVAADIDGNGYTELVILSPDRWLGILRGVPAAKKTARGLPAQVAPVGMTALDIVEKLSEPQVAARRLQIKAAYDANLVRAE